jgi:two-component system, OmpR family, phosphate regulon response regulator PhoB
MIPYVIVVEDEAALATLLQYNLEKEGYEVAIASDGEEALLMVSERVPDMIVLDWMLPKLSGIEVCRCLRADKSTPNIPIIMLTARSEEDERVRGLDTGADDYITKPFALSELLARIRAVLRRAKPSLIEESLHCGNMVLDRSTHKVLRHGKEVPLGPTEFRLLEHFMSQPGRVFSRTQLIDAIWGTEVDVEIRTVDVHVGRLRRALNAGHQHDAIRTVRSSGYALRAD